MTNLQISMLKEFLLTNRLGGICSTSVVGCNIRKYNGLLVVPIPELDSERHILLSHVDETIVQHGAEFNLGIHKFQGDNYSPKGHKYIINFEWEKVPATTYRVGGVVLRKEIMLCKSENRLLMRYSLLDAHSPTLLRIKPFLAYRSVREFTRMNPYANRNYHVETGGISMSMYDGYPELHMQVNLNAEFVDKGDWYLDYDYPRERERGYESVEDLYTPGYFELPIKKGQDIIVSYGLTPIKTNTLTRKWKSEIELRGSMSDFYNCLLHSAEQFYQEKEDSHYVVSGFPWFKCRARDFFISMPGLSLAIGKKDLFEKYMCTASKAILDWMHNGKTDLDVQEIFHPDVLLWALHCVKTYAKYTSKAKCFEKYGNLFKEIIDFILNGKHPNLFVHDNGLLYTNGKNEAVTWMNSQSNGIPIVPRTGYIVEFNALWYDALNFWKDMLLEQGDNPTADTFSDLILKVGASFRNIFINKFGYLYDYVDGDCTNWEVRPNMIFAIALENSPLTKEEQKRVLDVCTKELLTSKGMRSLTPKSGLYNPLYQGIQKERDLAYHQGTSWPWLTRYYLEAYLNIHKKSGLSFIENQLVGFEEELYYHSIGSIPEMFDGNPPFHGRGAISYAINVSSIIIAIRLLEDATKEENETNQ